MKIAAITDIGSCRQENQDNYCAQQLAGGTAWGIVCDGMGGVNGGRIAARIATDTMQQYFARHMKALQPGMEKTFLMRGFDITNRAVYEKSTSDPEMQGMGTTGVCAYASRGMAHVVHAGDSRAYLFHAGGLRQITRRRTSSPARSASRPTLCRSTTAAKLRRGTSCCCVPTA